MLDHPELIPSPSALMCLLSKLFLRGGQVLSLLSSSLANQATIYFILALFFIIIFLVFIRASAAGGLYIFFFNKIKKQRSHTRESIKKDAGISIAKLNVIHTYKES